VRLGWSVLLFVARQRGKIVWVFFFGGRKWVVQGEVVMGWNLAQEANQGSQGLGGMEWPCLVGWVIDTTLNTSDFIFLVGRLCLGDWESATNLRAKQCAC